MVLYFLIVCSQQDIEAKRIEAKRIQAKRKLQKKFRTV